MYIDLNYIIFRISDRCYYYRSYLCLDYRQDIFGKQPFNAVKIHQYTMVHVNIFYKIYNSNTSKENNLNKTNIKKIFSFLFKSLFFGNNAVEVECISSGFSTKIEEGKQRLVTKKRGICQSLWLWFCLHYGFH